MMNNLCVLPVVIPMAAGVLLIFTHARPALSRAIAISANILSLGVALALVETVRADGIQLLAFGNWPAPFGIVFTVDMLSALMVAVTMVVSTATLLFASVSLDDLLEKNFFYPLFQFLLMGVNGAFLTGDLFNLFVWFEVLLVSSYGLMALGSQAYQLQETFKYLVVNALSSALFLIGIALIYGATGTLNMADLVFKFPALAESGMAGVITVIFLVVFGIKAALFPLYVWLPRAYYGPPTVIAGLFGGLLTKVGVYALFRTVTLFFAPASSFVLPLLSFVAGATMLLGVLGALSQWDFKRILSYHIVSQIGYMIMGLAIYTPLALAGGIFYIIHHILVKTSLFLVAGAVEKRYGTTNLRALGGAADGSPLLATLFMLAGLALAGAPPLSGFVAKFMLLRSGLEAANYVIVAVSIVVSFLTLYSMMKIYRYVFWREETETAIVVPGEPVRTFAIASLVTLSLVMGLGGALLLPYVEIAAAQLLDPAAWGTVVLEARVR